MNLAMPPHVVEALTLRGQAAGRALVDRFADTPGTDPGLSWDNHRWVRYRSSLTALAEQLERFGSAWRGTPDGERSYPELVDRADDVGPDGYRFVSDGQRALALTLAELLAEAGDGSETSGTPVDREVATTRAGLPYRPGRLVSARRRPSRAAARHWPGHSKPSRSAPRSRRPTPRGPRRSSR